MRAFFSRPHPLLATACAVLLTAGALLWAGAALATEDLVLVAVLLALAVVAELVRVEVDPRLDITGSDCLFLLAIPFAGTPAALIVATAAIAAAWVSLRYRVRAVPLNVAAVLLPTAAAGAAFEALEATSFTLAIVAVALIALPLNIALILPLMGLLDGVPPRSLAPPLKPFAVAFAFQASFVVLIAVIAEEVGTGTAVLGVVLVVAYAYMQRLVLRAQDRAREYANLSWGVLSSLVRTLDERDARTARHCAAVARFSRDIARALGHDARGQELAHTAGLLHDIGKFALSDRVMEREGELTEEDWRAIRRHPLIGAELLRDVGVYGPVAQIVRAHHERLDGRGYPERLAGDDIPPLARVVAVAEVYDTLTAPDTYRTPMTSFEALRELRRVAGTQLDPACVEALATVLAGQDTGYRHAGDADFDAELDIQRRMNEAVT